MSLPLSIQNLFTDNVARFRSSAEAKNVEAALRANGKSYQTKISKSKKNGREFVVMLLESSSGN
jgi:hypothetical protein